MALTTAAGDAGRNSTTRDLGPLSWLVVVVALLATAAFALVVLGGDDEPSIAERTTPVTQTPEVGSPDAIERRAVAQQRIEAASASVSERGSINAVEHRALAGLEPAGTTDPVTETAIERGSADAAEQRGAGG